jgi:hypothetical protein
MLRDAMRQAERLAAIRLRYAINTRLDEQGIATPAGLAQATGLPAAEAAGLLRRTMALALLPAAIRLAR